jgi:broad-specificity NMP kinase
MSDVLSKRALKYISYALNEFVKKCEIVTNSDVDMDTYNDALENVKKMIKKLPSNPEKYIDENCLSQDMVDELESDAIEWEKETGYMK